MVQAETLLCLNPQTTEHTSFQPAIPVKRTTAPPVSVHEKLGKAFERVKIFYFRESERSAWFQMQDAGGSNNPPLGVSLSCDVVIGVIEVDRDISGLVAVERT